MASVVAQRGMEDRLSLASSLPDANSGICSPRSRAHPSQLDHSKRNITDYSCTPRYNADFPNSCSPEIMHSITSDYGNKPLSDGTETSTKYSSENSPTEYGSPLSVDSFLSENIDKLPNFDSGHSANPDPPVTPGRPVMVAKDNLLNSTVKADNPDGPNVYNSTTEVVEKDPSSCILFSKGKKRRRKAKNEKPPKDCEQRSKKGGGGGFRLWGYDGRQWLLLVVLLSGTLTSSFAVCLFPPFFPKIAQEKGATATIFGIIIGTNCLTAFLFTPIIGKKLQTIGVKFAFTAGLFCSGGCCVLSGFLEWFPGGAVFVILAILIRMTHAIANAGISTSTFAYIAAEFPENVAKIFAFSRTTMNVAQMLGPVVGGALYTLGGFKMPFLVMGTIQMAMTVVAFGYLADYKDAGNKTVGKKSEIQIIRLFAIPGIWVSFLTFIFSTMSNGFLSVTLEPLVLRKFDLGPLYVGLLFGLKDGANSIASPIWGWLCDRYRHVKIFILLASCLAFTSFVLLGPLPWLPIESTLGIVILALTLNGFGIGGQQVAGVVDAMREAVSAGLPDEAGTHGCVAGLWASLSGAGRFTSRAGTGILVDHIGFRNSSVVVVFLHGCVIMITLVYLLFCKENKYRRHQDIESAPGLCSSDMVVDGPNRVGTVFTTSPSDPVTTKGISVAVPNKREDIEDSIFFGSSPIPTPTKYARENCKYFTSSESS